MIAASAWLAVAAAPFIGSLLGVLIRRLPAGRPVAVARSACETCGHLLGPLELLPIASYLALAGRCRNCHAPIGRFHLDVELAAIAVPLCLLLTGARDPTLVWSGCLLGWGLLASGWIDASTFLLPDVLTLPLLLAGLFLSAWQDAATLADHAAAAIIGYLALRLVAFLYRRLRHRDGLGQGDAKLFALAGAWTGLAALPNVLLIAAVLGLLMAGIAILRGRTMNRMTRLPFGAPLAAAIWIVWLYQAVAPIV